jgi:Protein of unknown function (DUF3667)
MEPTAITCKNCGNHFTGKYCNECGEKVYTVHDKKLSHIFEEFFHLVTHLDSKFLKTLKSIFTKPGFVSREYCEGRRKKYFKPVSLFLIGVVIYLLFPLLQGLNISFDNHISNNNFLHIYYSRNWALHKMQIHHLTEYQLGEKFDHLSPKFAKLLLFVMLPLTALALRLIFRGRRYYYFDHFILATEINTTFLLLFFIVVPLLFIIMNTLFHSGLDYGDSSILFSVVQGLLIFLILISAFKRFYSVSFLWAFLASVIFIVAYLIALFIYRQLVFILIMLFI